MTRSARLTRTEIVDTALAHAEDGDLETLSTRGLAADLGVTPMALYRHVRNKDEILTAVVDVLLLRLGLPTDTGDWRGWLEELAGALRRLFVEQPVAVALFTRQPVTTPAARQRLAAAVDVLNAAGFTRDAAVRAYAAVHTYTVGFSALEAARRSAAADRPDATTPDDDEVALISAFVNEEQFAHGLRALLRGLSPAAASAPQ